MENKKIHIISFDVPYPPDYGGIIDVYYKILALKEAGVDIFLHCYYYEGHNPPNDELNKYCKEVWYYPRKASKKMAAFGKLPYITASRSDEDLLDRLLKDDYPILFEGLHTCFFLSHLALKNRLKLVRAHNVEHEYYLGLAEEEKGFFKKRFLKKEARRLKNFEPELANASRILSIARSDVKHFKRYALTFHVPPFFKDDHAAVKVNKSGVEGKFILFHGNLSVPENAAAVHYILDELVPNLQDYKFVIAGKNPSSFLVNEVSIHDNVRLIANPPGVTMDSLIQYAHLNLLLTFQRTGVKLKLLHALEAGKFVLINEKMNDDGIFSTLCSVADSKDQQVASIKKLMLADFTDEHSQKRRQEFMEIFGNQKNAETIVGLIS